ncbi:MAG: substrate-binding domain-containing protein [gamma proteobacterium symbiont of Taylorina sp.]|nr:substrate-binding domain-containing protein [gamma proteobacterium symbiont of Taylorina sp.]
MLINYKIDPLSYLPGTLFVLLFITFLSNPVSAVDSIIRLATTTSTENSGLLHYLLPEFEKKTGYEVHTIAVGTGKALRMGKDGDVDVLLVHAPEAEKVFVDNRYGVKRYQVMANDFVVIGDRKDPASIRDAASIESAFHKIQSSQSVFISRGDDSGTHKKELQIWQAANIPFKEKWHREIGQGMGKTIQMANELGAYTLTDRGTWLSFQDKVNLEILYQGDVSLFNPYGIIAVNPERYADINIDGANALIQWLISEQTQKLIGQYKKQDQILFFPHEPSLNKK